MRAEDARLVQLVAGVSGPPTSAPGGHPRAALVLSGPA